MIAFASDPSIRHGDKSNNSNNNSQLPTQRNQKEVPPLLCDRNESSFPDKESWWWSLCALHRIGPGPAHTRLARIGLLQRKERRRAYYYYHNNKRTIPPVPIPFDVAARIHPVAGQRVTIVLFGKFVFVHGIFFSTIQRYNTIRETFRRQRLTVLSEAEFKCRMNKWNTTNTDLRRRCVSNDS